MIVIVVYFTLHKHFYTTSYTTSYTTNPTMSFCRVAYCNFSNTHTNKSHICGTCGESGHGQVECSSQHRKDALKQFWTEELAPAKHCEICKDSLRLQRPVDDEEAQFHTTAAHHCSKCGKRHGEDECIIQSFDNYSHFGNGMFDKEQFIAYATSRLPTKVYCRLYAGMGATIYVKVNDQDELYALFMHQDSWGQYGDATDERPILNKFIEDHEQIDDSFVQSHFMGVDVYGDDDDGGDGDNTTAECPMCRTAISKSDSSKIYSISERCCVCLDKTVNMYFKECGHACVCDECLENL